MGEKPRRCTLTLPSPWKGEERAERRVALIEASAQ